MSNRIVFDPLLVRYLAAELDGVLRGRACAAAPLFAPDLGVVLPLDGGEALRLDLHPERGWIRPVAGPHHAEELDSVCSGVEAPADERMLIIRLAAPERFGAAARRLVVELHTNQWNALLVSDDGDRILAALRARVAGTRSLRPGAVYEPPAGRERYGVVDADREAAIGKWSEEIGGVPPERRRSALLASFAWTGTPNADAILGGAAVSGDPAESAAAFERWWSLRALPPPRPVLMETAAGPLPYPVPLHGRAAAPIDSLLQGMELAAAAVAGVVAAPAAADEAIRACARRVDAAERRLARLQEELAAASDPEEPRSWGDLLLAHLHRVPRGAAEVEVPGWDGGVVRIELDPSLTPAENAALWYDEARKRSRAAARLPRLVEEARAEAERWRGASAAAEASGALPAWAEAELSRSEPEQGTGAADGAEARPYRTFRTSGGLEVRVGRSARANDRLTFAHSSPNDVWLHARSVPGSHVILRWPDATGAPPARDLHEAAVLAARFSKARTSAVVAVDWTRRKHVRKPRGAPPGSVTLQRAKTLFVEPDPRTEERLRAD